MSGVYIASQVKKHIIKKNGLSRWRALARSTVIAEPRLGDRAICANPVTPSLSPSP